MTAIPADMASLATASANGKSRLRLLLPVLLPPLLLLLMMLPGRCSAQRVDYCRLDSCNGQTHTMCAYRGGSIGKGCGRQMTPGSVKVKQRLEILAAHNKIRRDVKAGKYAKQGLPPAAVMPDLKWDAELAEIAQRWADQCREDHDRCRNVRRFYVGQNAAWTWGVPMDWTKEAIGGWFHSELPYFRQRDLVFRSVRDPSSGKQIGHLTQVVWADTRFIGCGYSESQERSWVKRSYICNYGPSGNILGEPMYKIAGSSGSKRSQKKDFGRNTRIEKDRYDVRPVVRVDRNDVRPVVRVDRNDVRVVKIDRGYVPMVRTDRRDEPVVGIDRSDEPVVRKDRRDAPVVETNRSDEAAIRVDRNIVPVPMTDRGYETVVRTDRNYEPMKNDRNVVTIVRKDVNYVPVVRRDRNDIPVVKTNDKRQPARRRNRYARTDYCRLNSCNGQTHTMCAYQAGSIGKGCGRQMTPGSVKVKQRLEILAAHNKIRRDVKAGKYAKQGLPPAAVMPDLKWDAELAEIAQRWADQCREDHDRCRNVRRFYVGQNAAWTWGVPLDWTKEAIGGWFHSELPYFRQRDLVFRSVRDPATGKQIGHLTQVVWAETTLIGCGYAETREGSWVKRAYICNYGPTGNVLGQKIYEVAGGSQNGVGRRGNRREHIRPNDAENPRGGKTKRDQAHRGERSERSNDRDDRGEASNSNVRTETRIHIVHTEDNRTKQGGRQESKRNGTPGFHLDTKVSVGPRGKKDVYRVGMKENRNGFFKDVDNVTVNEWEEFMDGRKSREPTPRERRQPTTLQRNPSRDRGRQEDRNPREKGQPSHGKLAFYRRQASYQTTTIPRCQTNEGTKERRTQIVPIQAVTVVPSIQANEPARMVLPGWRIRHPSNVHSNEGVSTIQRTSVREKKESATKSHRPKKVAGTGEMVPKVRSWAIRTVQTVRKANHLQISAEVRKMVPTGRSRTIRTVQTVRKAHRLQVRKDMRNVQE